VSRRAANIKIRTQSENFKQLVFLQSSMYMLLGAIVFVVPAFSETVDSASITKNAMAVLFVVGACFGLIQSISMMAAADAAASHIEQLEAKLRAAIVSPPTTQPEGRFHFGKVEMRNVVFRYPDRPGEPGFQIGPVDFTLNSGELIFITGGNGSGKSTFMKVLAGLYEPSAGNITVDGIDIIDENRDDHRALITAVFTDYHLFQQLFGIQGPDAAEVDRLLHNFELETKTHLVDGGFNTLDLSGGQRRRLALIVGLLEKRPLLLLDEWTANQDPEFRRKFYHAILPELKKAGLTVVIVTHDDRYLDELDLPARRLRMDEGRFA
jgi:putative ATP-binding cassette transporter